MLPGPPRMALSVSRIRRENAERKGAREVVSVSDLARVLPWSQDETELVTELQSGSSAAFDFLVTHYSASVYSLVSGMVSEVSDAADITQDVFLKAFRGIRGFRRGSSLKTWLYRIAVREALNHRRWLWRHHRQQASIDAEPGEGHSPLNIEDNSDTPFDQAVSHEVQEAVRQALRGIPEVFRSAVILRDLEGMSYEEVAEVLGISTGTVKSRILRGRRLLREILAPILGSSHGANATGVPETRQATRVCRSHRSGAVLQTSLFLPVKDKPANQLNAEGWENSDGPGNSEGGV